ncbi:hypothetical protein DS901_12565 [Loktanella sp. D2R18]|nr:hypothetical protein DS901_12565 [Loktanella sp. D2R18]
MAKSTVGGLSDMCRRGVGLWGGMQVLCVGVAIVGFACRRGACVRKSLVTAAEAGSGGGRGS